MDGIPINFTTIVVNLLHLPVYLVSFGKESSIKGNSLLPA